MEIAAIVLAAGESRRLGQPKQLIRLQGETLLNRIIGAITEAGITNIVVVLGASYDKIRATVEPGVELIENKRWKEGMGTSLNTAMSSVSDTDAVLVTLVDQPRVQSSHLRKLVMTYQETGKPVCSQYDGTKGVPAIFPKSSFSALGELKGDHGARKVLRELGEEVVCIECPECSFDIDTPADLAKLDIE